MNALTHDIKSLNDSAGQLLDSLAHLAATAPSIEDLRRQIFPRPGWTTPAEFALVAASLAALKSQVDLTATFAASVVNAARQVGR